MSEARGRFGSPQDESGEASANHRGASVNEVAEVVQETRRAMKPWSFLQSPSVRL